MLYFHLGSLGSLGALRESTGISTGIANGKKQGAFVYEMVCAKLSGIHEQFLGLWKMKVPFYRALYFEHWVNLRDPLSRFRITDCDLLRPSALKKGLPSPSLIQALPSASLVPQALIDGFSGCARRHGV